MNGNNEYVLASTKHDPNNTYQFHQKQKYHMTILLSIKKELFLLSKCQLRSLNETTDCALASYENNELTECILSCHHSLEGDAICIGIAGTNENDKILRYHFILSACLLAARSSNLLGDNKSALGYSRAGVKLSLDKEYLFTIENIEEQKEYLFSEEFI